MRGGSLRSDSTAAFRPYRTTVPAAARPSAIATDAEPAATSGANAERLGCADLLDTHGGSDVVQVAPASVVIDRFGRFR